MALKVGRVDWENKCNKPNKEKVEMWRYLRSVWKVKMNNLASWKKWKFFEIFAGLQSKSGLQGDVKVGEASMKTEKWKL